MKYLEKIKVNKLRKLEVWEECGVLEVWEECGGKREKWVLA